MKLSSLQRYLLDDGWKETHRSKHAGKISSIYFAKRISGKERTIRISDHELGYTVYGEQQGGHWDADIVIQPDLSLDDHIAAINNDDYGSSLSGFSGGYTFREFEAE